MKKVYALIPIPGDGTLPKECDIAGDRVYRTPEEADIARESLSPVIREYFGIYEAQLSIERLWKWP